LGLELSVKAEGMKKEIIKPLFCAPSTGAPKGGAEEKMKKLPESCHLSDTVH
jgi:hypothetical protein